MMDLASFVTKQPAISFPLTSTPSNYTVYKVIYYDYAWRFEIVDLYELVESTFKDRWNLHLSRHWFRFLVLTQGDPPSLQLLTDPNESAGTFLNRVFPRWQTHQHRAGNRIRHPDDEETAFVVELQCETCSPPEHR